MEYLVSQAILDTWRQKDHFPN